MRRESCPDPGAQRPDAARAGARSGRAANRGRALPARLRPAPKTARAAAGRGRTPARSLMGGAARARSGRAGRAGQGRAADGRQAERAHSAATWAIRRAHGGPARGGWSRSPGATCAEEAAPDRHGRNRSRCAGSRRAGRGRGSGGGVSRRGTWSAQNQRPASLRTVARAPHRQVTRIDGEAGRRGAISAFPPEAGGQPGCRPSPRRPRGRRLSPDRRRAARR